MNKYFQKVNVLVRTGFFHIFGSSVINKIIAFLSSAILVRILSKSEYGVFSYAWNIYTIIMIANGFGVVSAVLQMSSERSGDKEFSQVVFSYGTRFGMAVDVLLAILMLGIGLLAPFSIRGADTIICMLCGLPALQLLYDLTTVYLRAEKRNQDYSHYTVINTVLILVATVCGALLYREKGLIVGYYVAYTVSVVIGYSWLHIRLYTRENTHMPPQEKKTLLYISAVAVCNNGLSSLLYHLDVLVIGIVLADEVALAGYKVATLIPNGLTFIPLTLIVYLYPYFAEHRLDGKWCLSKYKTVLISLGAANLLISVGLFIFAPLIIRLLFGSQYLDAVPIFRILSLNYCISGTFRIISGNLLVTQRKFLFNTLVAVISSLVNVVGDWFFIQWWGAMGAAYATVCVVVVSSVMSTWYLIYTFKKVARDSSEK